jgi:hypothetical protein
MQRHRRHHKQTPKQSSIPSDAHQIMQTRHANVKPMSMSMRSVDFCPVWCAEDLHAVVATTE